MRARYLFIVCIGIQFAILVIIWHHLRDLYEVGRTYATFHGLIQQRPDVLYRYQAAVAERGIPHPDSTKAQVPKIIHQIFLTGGRDSSLEKYKPSLADCRSLHPEWEINLWTDGNATSFMRDRYPAIFPHYQGYKQHIQRANILRYALLDHYGGVYLDLDVQCLAPLDHLTHLPWLTPGAYPAGVNNAFILARPHHGLLAALLPRVPRHDLRWPLPYVENMLSTGCMFFTNRWMDYVRRMAAAEDGPGGMPERDRVYILADERGEMGPHMLRGAVRTPLFAHGGASSWHGWDAAAIVWMGEHYVCCAGFVGAGMMMASVWVWKALVCRSGQGRRWGTPWYASGIHHVEVDEGERSLAEEQG